MKFTVQSINSSNIEIEIHKGEKIVFLGANGTGKSRLGLFLENSVFNHTTVGFEQNKASLKQLSSELDQLQNQKKLSASSRSALYELDSIKYSSDPNNFYKNIGYSYNLQETIQQNKEDCIKFITSNITKIDKKSSDIYIQLSKIKQQIEEFEYNQDSSFDFCQRVSAHRSLVPRTLNKQKDFQTSRNELLYGSSTNTQGTHDKWMSQEEVEGNFGRTLSTTKYKGVGLLQDDFGKLMVALTSEEAEIGAKIKQGSLPRDHKSTLDQVLEIWNNLLPHRKLKVDGLKIFLTNTHDGASYELQDASEGERAIFYLLGQCLFSKEKSLIILDEPDLHIHKAILPSLFDAIELQKKDCAFIYITHNLDFANSRIGDKYILLSYSHPRKWNVMELGKNKDVPEKILSEISGVRKNILFIEGSKSSLDKIYSKVYNDLTIISAGSCEQVISYTKVLNKNEEFHRVKCFGIIDRDGLSDEDVKELKNNNIYCLPVSIIENLFLLPNVAEQLYSLVQAPSFEKEKFIKEVITWIKDNPDWRVKSIKDSLQGILQRRINELPNNLNKIDGEANIILSIKEVVDDEKNKFETRLNTDKQGEEQLRGLLLICRGKHLLGKLATALGIRDKKKLEEKILRCTQNEEFLRALKQELPIIS